MPLPANIPNLHPLVVHFPIALALTALLFRFVLVFKPAWSKMEWSATAMTILAALGGGAAWLAGKQAAGAVGAISLAAEQQLSRHADLAGVTVLLLAAAAVLGIIHTLSLARTQSYSRRTSLGAFLVLLLASGFLTVTADLGGGLVYRQGVGVQSAQEAPAAPAVTQGDVRATASAPMAPAPVQDWDPRSSSPTDFQVDGVGLILLPGTYDDAAVTAQVDPARFTGDIAVIHHVQSLDRWEGFLLTGGNKAQLVRRDTEQERVLKSTSMVFPRERTTLRVTAAQGHFKGLVDGDLIVHGHDPSGQPGRVGIYYSGQGILRIESLSVESSTMNHE